MHSVIQRISPIANISRRILLGYLALLVLMAGMVLPGIATLPPMDRDEARFAQASRQMLESGDFVTVRFQHELRAKKPVGIYWLQSASAQIFGKDHIASYRLPSFLASIGIVFGVYFFGLRLMSPMSAFLAAMCMGTSLILATEARLAKTDAVLTLLILIQQYALWVIYHANQKARYVSGRWAALMWGACGLGILVKGPIAPAILLLTAISLMLAQRAWVLGMRPLFGLIIVSAIVMPWALLVSADTDGVFLTEAIGRDFLGKLRSGQESHAAPPLAHLVLLPIVFYPASLLIPRAVATLWYLHGQSHEKSQGQTRHQNPPDDSNDKDKDWVRFMLAWIVPFWLVLEVTPTKLPHYTLPLMPAIALLVCHFALLPNDASQKNQTKTKATINAKASFRMRNIAFAQKYLAQLGVWLGVAWQYAALMVGCVIALIFMLVLLIDWATLARGRGLALDFTSISQIDNGFGIAIIALLLAATTLGYGWQWLKYHQRHSLIFMLVAAALFHSISLGGVLPSLRYFHLSPAIDQALTQAGLSQNPIAAAGYHEPSLVFLLGRDVLLFSPRDAALFLAESSDGVAIVEARTRREFNRTANAVGVRLGWHGTIRGFNYSNGKTTQLLIYTVSE